MMVVVIVHEGAVQDDLEERVNVVGLDHQLLQAHFLLPIQVVRVLVEDFEEGDVVVLDAEAEGLLEGVAVLGLVTKVRLHVLHQHLKVALGCGEEEVEEFGVLLEEADEDGVEAVLGVGAEQHLQLLAVLPADIRQVKLHERQEPTVLPQFLLQLLLLPLHQVGEELVLVLLGAVEDLGAVLHLAPDYRQELVRVFLHLHFLQVLFALYVDGFGVVEQVEPLEDLGEPLAPVLIVLQTQQEHLAVVALQDHLLQHQYLMVLKGFQLRESCEEESDDISLEDIDQLSE
mmetsp:Transcript_1254/g.1284  ORF Transcript_1254/g.1284 Transcript_1254/m.1284 type:complete len:287 (-) Transcript_1254:819-1679(-)